MRVRSFGVAAALATGAAGTVGCGAAVEGEGDGARVEARADAIFNGFDDVDTPEANAVVNVGGGCTGTLVTSTLVLTANHCLLGASCRPGLGGAAAEGQFIQVGADSAAFKIIPSDASNPTPASVPGSRIVRAQSFIGRPTNCGSDRDSDLALLDIYPPIVNQAYPTRPTLAPLSGGPQQIRFAGWGLTQNGYPTIRQTNVPFITSASLDAGGDGEIAIVLTDGNLYAGIGPGDSGGPLFVLRSSGLWDQVGVLYGGNAGGVGDISYWTNLTNDGNDPWVAAAAADPNRPGKWRGQTDYDGACDASRDADCDHFDDAPVCTVVNGKQVCKVNDNCPGVYNPAQLAAPDADGDGVADAPFADGDGDGVPDYCDLQPQCSYLLSAAGKDYDGDGLCGSYDELCPFDDANDEDGDGVCDGADNCPGTSNPTQANCNSEAEEATKSTVLGDACDPVPCPSFRVARGSTTECASGACATVTRIPDLAGRDNLIVDTVGSSNVVTGGNERVVPAITAHRYCIEGSYPIPGDGFKSTNCFTPDAVNDALALTPLALEDQSTRFHRVRVDDVSNAQSSTPALVYGSTSPLATYRWRHTVDFTDWRASTWGASWVKDPHAQGIASRSLQSGRYWLHANTPIGQTAELGGNGVHTKLDGTQGESLANHYERAYPVTVAPHLDEDLTCVGSNCFFPFAPCVGQRCFELVPCVGANCEGHCIACALGQLDDFDPYEVRVFGALQGGGLGLLTRTGGLTPLDPRSVSEGARVLLTTPGRTVLRAVEPNRNIGRALESPQALVLDSSTLGVIERLDVRGSTLFTGRELRPGSAEGQRAAPAPAPSSTTGPSARSGAATAYSAAVGRAFVVGGRDSSGKELRDVWTTSLDDESASWVNLPLSGPVLGSVVATTYSAVDGHLWVLDEVRGLLGLKLGRLLQIDARTGETKILGAWPRLGIFNKHWLGIDRDGSILLTASSSRLHGSHTIIRLATIGDAKVTGVYAGARPLAAAPLVDLSGYTLVGPKRPASPGAAEVRRLGDLGMASGTWSHVGSCL